MESGRLSLPRDSIWKGLGRITSKEQSRCTHNLSLAGNREQVEGGQRLRQSLFRVGHSPSTNRFLDTDPPGKHKITWTISFSAHGKHRSLHLPHGHSSSHFERDASLPMSSTAPSRGFFWTFLQAAYFPMPPVETKVVSLSSYLLGAGLRAGAERRERPIFEIPCVRFPSFL